MTDQPRQDDSHSAHVGTVANASDVVAGVWRRRKARYLFRISFESSMSDFDDAFSIPALAQTFDELLIRRYDVVADEPRILPGADRIHLEHFGRDRNKHLSAIHRKVVQGRYTFSPFLGVEIPKPGSRETRPISLSTIRDTIVQRALYDYLYPQIDSLLSESAFGYRMGLSAHDAIHAITEHVRNGHGWIVDVDLTKFFDTVSHSILLEKVAALAADRRAERLVFRFLRTGRVEPEQVAENRKQQSRQRRFLADLRAVGVPQGGVLSGLLSNLYLANFDKAIRDQYPGYVRYADDFVICCSTSSDCECAYSLVKHEIGKLVLTLNASKTRAAVPIAKGIDFLGFRVTDKGIRVRGRNVHKFKNRIRGVIDGQCKLATPEATLERLIHRLNFKIRGPDEEQQERLRIKADVDRPRRRSWVGFFRIVTDIGQLRRLDRWIRGEVANFMWKTHRHRVRYSDLREAGLLTLVNCLYKTRL